MFKLFVHVLFISTVSLSMFVYLCCIGLFCCHLTTVEMAKSPKRPEQPAQHGWQTAPPPKKMGLNITLKYGKKYQNFISGNELLTIHSASEAITKRTIFLLTFDLKTRKLVGVSRGGMKEVVKCPNFRMKVLTRRSNAMWNILLM